MGIESWFYDKFEYPMFESWYIIPGLRGHFKRFQIQFGTDFNGWAIPFGISAGQCDFECATCVTLQFFCLYVTLMVYKDKTLKPRGEIL